MVPTSRSSRNLITRPIRAIMTERCPTWLRSTIRSMNRVTKTYGNTAKVMATRACLMDWNDYVGNLVRHI